MRNFRNKERDKLPILYVPPRTYPEPYVGKLQWRIMLLQAEFDSMQRQRDEFKELAEKYWLWYSRSSSHAVKLQTSD